MRVLLHDNQICERGTTTSMLDYGRALRSRGHEVEISFWSGSPANVPLMIERVGREFTMHPHSQRGQLPRSLRNFDAAYFIKAGYQDGLFLPRTHNLIHVVFQNYEPHGSRYAYVSQWLAETMRSTVTGKKGRRDGLMAKGLRAQEYGCKNALMFDYLDHIVDIPAPQTGAREELGIPEDAFVIMRFGAIDSFDIPWVHRVVENSLEENQNWYFLGLNTQAFTNHPRAIHVPLVADNREKATIISAGDVFLTARGEGEAFGIAIVEALQLGLPVLAWNGGAYRNHVSMLKDLGGLFTGPRDLKRRLKRLSSGKDPSSHLARKQRGDKYRPKSIAPVLEKMLLPQD